MLAGDFGAQGRCVCQQTQRAFLWNVSRNPLQDPIQVLQGVSVDQPPSAWITLAQVVSVVQAHAPPWTTVAL